MPYTALSYLPDGIGQDAWTLCFSPELFLRIDSGDLITAEPMKGTAPILHDGQDECRTIELQNDPKNRAENVTIVDLLRNNLDKIAQTGRIRVPEPFKVPRFGSVWQMASAVEAQALTSILVADILRAAFLYGSITGTPKRMSIQIIESLESEPRGLYIDSIGPLHPCDTGLRFKGVFNVVIRTLSLKPVSDSLYQGVYSVGSEIVIDSDPEARYREYGWKARFLNDLRPDFGIFETMRMEDKQCRLLDLRLGRLNSSAQAFSLPWPQNAIEQTQHYIDALPNGLFRVEAALFSDGLALDHTAVSELDGQQYIILSEHTLSQRDCLRHFKTTRREIFGQAWKTAEGQGALDSLFFNSDGLLLEGGRSNVFIKYQGQWFTLSSDLGILDRVMHQAVLKQPRLLGADTIKETRITCFMLENAGEIRLSNALRGVFTVLLHK